MAELTSQEVAEDYRRQIQEAAARRAGLVGFETRDPVVWFDAHKELLAREALESGATGEEIQDVLAGMRTEIETAPTGTRFDDPFGRIVLGRLVERVRGFCEAQKISVRGGVAYGLTPVTGLSASSRPVLGTDASIIELSVPLMRFASEVGRLVSETIGHASRTDGRWDVSFDPQQTLSVLSSHPVLLKAWIELLTNYAEIGWPSSYDPASASTFGALQTRTQLTRAAQLFAVAHEFGHHVFRHGEVTSSEGASDPMPDEYEADAFAIKTSLHVARAEVPENFYLRSGVGGVVLLVASELVARTRDILAQGKLGSSADGKHPPLALRIQNMSYIETGLDRESVDRYRHARVCFAVILELVWMRVLPYVQAQHDLGVRPEGESA